MRGTRSCWLKPKLRVMTCRIFFKRCSDFQNGQWTSKHQSEIFTTNKIFYCGVESRQKNRPIKLAGREHFVCLFPHFPSRKEILKHVQHINKIWWMKVEKISANLRLDITTDVTVRKNFSISLIIDFRLFLILFLFHFIPVTPTNYKTPAKETITPSHLCN